LQTDTVTLQTDTVTLQTDTVTLQRCKAAWQADTVIEQQHTVVNCASFGTVADENGTLFEGRKGNCGARIQAMATD